MFMTEMEFIEYLTRYKLSLIVEEEKLVLKGNKSILTEGAGNNTPDKNFIIQYIKDNKPALLNYLSQQEGAGLQAANKNIEAVYKLSGLQEGILFHSLYNDEALNYTNQFTCDISKVDLDMFVKSWDLLLKKYSILRSAFFYDTFKVPVQSVYKNVNIPVEIIDVTSKSQPQISNSFDNFLKEDRKKGFDYKTPPLMRLTFFKVSSDGYKMIWTFHHLLFDGWSLPILIGEGLKTYEQLIKGIDVKVGQVDNFQDYIKYLDRLDKEKEETYWKDYLTPLDHGTLLPFTNHSAHAISNAEVVNRSLILGINKEETARLVDFTHKAKVTVNTLMQAVWSYLLSGYTNSSEVVFGVIVSGRPAELPFVEQRVGMYINTLPLLAQVNAEDHITDWLAQLQNQQITSRQFQYTPLKKIKTWTGIKEDLFDSLLVFENYPVDEMLSENTWSVAIENANFSEQTNYPLTILIGQSGDISINFQYNPTVISGDNVEKIRGHFKSILDQIISGASNKISDLTLLTQPEQEQLLNEFAGATTDYSHADVIKMLQDKAKAHPNKACILHGTERITYQAFNQRVNRLSHYLQSKGVKKDVLVGVYMNRSIDMVTALLAILKTGGAYVPIDVSYPIERVSYQLQDSAAAFVLTDATSAALLQGATTVEIIQIDREETFKDYSSENPDVPISSDSLAYVMYTSGSTGKPKGVMIEHRSVRAFIGWCHKEFSASPFDIVYAGTSISFDLSIFELCYSLSAGKTIRVLQNGLEAPQYLSTEKNILLNTVPSVIESLLKEKTDLSNVTVINMAGEPISAYVQQHLDQQNIEVRNLYGPTEDTTYSTIYRMHKGRPLLIGKPIDNTTVYILNDQLQLVPMGVAGEICIGGAGLARGYLNNGKLTEEKFIKNPFENTEDRRQEIEDRKQKIEDRREEDRREEDGRQKIEDRREEDRRQKIEDRRQKIE